MKQVITISESQYLRLTESIISEQEKSFSACFTREGLKATKGCQTNDIVTCKSDIVAELASGKIDATKLGRIAKCVQSGGTIYKPTFQ